MSALDVHASPALPADSSGSGLDGPGGPGGSGGSGRPSPRPRSAGARALLWAGVGLGVLAIAQVAYQGVDWLAATTTVSSASYAAAPVVELTADGDVTVAGSSTDSITVERRARTGLQETTYSVNEAADRVTIEHTCPRWWSNGVCQADLTVDLPQGTTVVVRSTDGAVRAEGIIGDLDLRTWDGSVNVLGAGGAVEARSASGHVEVDGAGGDVAATTGDGRVTVRGASGAVTAKSSSGRVLVDDAQGDVTAVTGDGDVEVRGVSGSAVAKSSSGGVRVAAVTGDVEAVTGDGDVVVRGTGKPVALQISTGDGRSTVEAPTDPGSSRTVTIRSSSGDVSYLDAE